MQYSGKPPRPSSKIKNYNNQITHPYNGGLHFVSAPNISNSGQLQVNRKYINNINEFSVLQYRSTTNMQIKNNLEMNHFQNFRHQQQAFMYKNTHYHNNMNPNMHQKFLNNRPMQRKNIIDQQERSTAFLPQHHRKPEFLSKSSKDFRNLQDANNKNKSKYPEHTKHLLPVQAGDGNANLVRHKVSAKVIENVGNDKENNKTDIEQIIEKLLNSSNDQSLEQHNSNISTKTAREKTPMCLINDLARFNKISFQYRLTSENGPAHCKRFTVTLILGNEEYTAEGLKIKEAQHLAAKEAIEKTKYKHPAPKVIRSTDDDALKPHITPTVELNALAMKLGQQTYYIIDHQQIESNLNYRSMNQPMEALVQQQQQTGAAENILNDQRRQNLPRYPNRFLPFQHMIQNGTVPSAYTFYSPACPSKVTLTVGANKFVGVGRTLQLAKHDAATNALKELKEQIEKEQVEIQNGSIEESDNKSPISSVFEIGIKRNLSVDFKVVREEGPAHMRTFVTACIVGDIMTEGEGTGKKTSKKKAANKMLEELKKLPPLSPVATPVKRTKPKPSSKKIRDQSKDNTLAERKDEEKPLLCHRNKKITAEAEQSSPINKLIEWHQNKKEKEPEFTLINGHGLENARRKEFVVEVSSNNIVVRGFGINKRLAKQDAAQKFLNAVAGDTEQPTIGRESTSRKSNETSNKMSNSKTLSKKDAVKKILRKETDSKISTTTERKEIQNTTKKEKENNSSANKEASLKQETTEPTATTPSTVISSTEAPSKESNTNSNKNLNLHMKDQLMYLGKLLGFEVEFSDYPKGNHNEFLTIVMLSTTPPQICHGVGVDANESQEDAAKNALKILSEMGLNNAVKS